MKEIIGRQEIAKVLNFGEYPVLKINMDQEAWMDVLYRGDKVRVDFGKFKDGSRFLQQGYLLYNKKDERITISAESTMLVKDLGYEDYMEAVEYGSSQILGDNQEVVVVMYSNNKKECKVYLGKTSIGRKFCITIMDIE
jgi:hypothetical protein